jgi:hypothetical protein
MVIALASRKYVLFLAMVSLLSLPLVMLMGMSIVSVPVKPVVKTVVKPIVEPVVKPVVEPVVKYDHHGEKFLAYLPHSGLSNQRTELENALLLASYLNRTLIVPPAFLGKMHGWHHLDSMDKDMDQKTRPQPWWNQCNDQHSIGGRPCHARTNYISVPWDFLHESMGKLNISMRHIRHVSTENIQKMLTLDDDEIYKHQDSSVYSWELCDKRKSKCAPVIGRGHQYDSKWVVEDLRKIKHPLIQLQGMFGAGRVAATGREHYYLRSEIRARLTYKNAMLDAVTESIVKELGGKYTFLAIHVRMGDRQFLGGLQKNLDKKIVFLEKELAKLGCNQPFTTHCSDPPKIFLATDAKDPRRNAKLAPLFERFPQIAILSDFSHLLSPLDEALKVSQPPQESVIRFMLPIIDTMVPANAKVFMGTPGSTYSKYIERLHAVYISPKYF